MIKTIISYIHTHRNTLCLILLISIVIILLGSALAQESSRPHPEKVITAIRVNPTPPVIDGILDDKVWKLAPIADGFMQREPKEGEPPAEDTAFQIAYDDRAIYIGVTCYDKEPDKIIARLTRRDGWVEADWVSINLDTHHDHQTGNWFCVNAAGMLNDGQIFNDGWEDNNWDGVWEAKAAIHDRGWSAEYKIPYHVLRFSSSEKYVWGINALRHISRKNEKDHWILVRHNDNGWISHFGHIEGIQGINPPKHLEFIPFTLGRTTLNPDKRDLFSSAGLDLRYGITSDISINATINPDFGQVEADPAILNLSVFETFFEEKRPFFVEGSTVFSMPQPDIPGVGGFPQLFYSRRIGRQPGQFPIPENSEVIEIPNSTTILGAAKLSGKTKSKTAFGIMNAVTANEYATIKRNDAASERFRIEPLTNLFIGRIQQDMLKKSNIGAMLTAVNRDGVTPSYTGDIDTHLKLQKYSLFTRFAGSQTGPLNDRKTGYDALVYTYKFSDWYGGQAFLEARSPEFDVNDLGFMDRADKIQAGTHLYIQRQKPWLIARKSGFNINLWSSWNYDGINLAKGINLNNWNELKNSGFFMYGISREFEALDDLETRGGPLMVRPAHIWGWLALDTDGRKMVSLHSFNHGSRSDDGRNREYNIKVSVDIRPVSNIQFSIGPNYHAESRFAQWIKNVDDDGDGKQDHYVFGKLKSQVLDFTTRLSVSFTTNLSLQLYLQPFIAVGDYSDFKELARPESYEFIPYTELDFNPDFSQRSLRSNAVLRWEYRPGSALFFVWSQSRSAFTEIDNPDMRPYEDLINSFTDKGENVFLVKLSYWLGL